ncbi:MAG TPA: type II toxin-antitoxin system HicB family antitoxin [Thermomicrobiales bacterium]|nr:type II toxin-antitoxin system HicB family antitoxin [Thermomicrobiales bacterium]
MRRYRVVISPEPDGSAWNAVVPALPGCRTWGESIEEALAMAQDAVAVYLAGEAESPPSDAPLGIADDAVVATVEIDDGAGPILLRA